MKYSNDIIIICMSRTWEIQFTLYSEQELIRLLVENMRVYLFSNDSLPWKSLDTKEKFLIKNPCKYQITGVLADKLNDVISLPKIFFLQLAILDYIFKVYKV